MPEVMLERQAAKGPEDAVFHRRRLRAPLRNSWVLILFCAGALAGQWLAGAFQADLGETPDETAHFVTGLMIGDYARSGARLSPLQFAEKFYLHYPRVSFGIWPPMYHLTLGAWIAGFGGSRGSALGMQALIAGLFAFLLFIEVRRRWGSVAGFVVGLLLLSLTAVRVSTASIMPDLEVSLFAFAATLLFARYLETERPREAILFGIAASASILTKYNALALAGLPLIAVALSGRWRLLKTKVFWIPAAVVLMLCGPWYATHLGLIRYAAEPVPPFTINLKAVVGNAQSIGASAGWLAALLALAWVVLRLLRRGRLEAIDASLVALVGSLWAFHSFAYPSVETRYLIAALPAVLLLGMRALSWAAARSGVRHPAVPAACACGLVLACAAGGFQPYTKRVHGFGTVVDQVRLPEPSPVYLVAADATGEGALVAEVAMREARPRSIVLRSSKVLASCDEMGERYRTLYRTPEEILGFLEGAGVAALIFRPLRSLDHHRQLQELISRYPDRWKSLGRFGSDTDPVYAYSFVRGEGSTERRPIRIDMRYTLGRTIQ
jgi:hypothetical protein